MAVDQIDRIAAPIRAIPSSICSGGWKLNANLIVSPPRSPAKQRVPGRKVAQGASASGSSFAALPRFFEGAGRCVMTPVEENESIKG
jgi:hypothetical protein